MSITLKIGFVLLSYLVGSIPVGYLLTKLLTGKNILKQGSGNVGSTNVGRVAGKKIAVVTQLLDMTKGFLPVAIYLFFADEKIGSSYLYVYWLALAAIIGHDFSVFLKFKGGKGVNTTLGASVLLAPISVFISVAIYFIVKWQFKYVSLGSIILGILLPLTEFIFHGFNSTFYYLLVCMGLIILMHRTNIVRLLNQQELSS
ncbi:MAG: acyl-phosphate glycerol 3-phosphate acyltransferase [Bacteroidetes bacterium CG_4_9_14_3_um_filter_41_19]|nr:MAG: acyl-phosphate glycerol 3-phosphate acyltransferase [Bacteroidetes bacterium CG_4_9_14_3_um_filter_41_19]